MKQISISNTLVKALGVHKPSFLCSQGFHLKTFFTSTLRARPSGFLLGLTQTEGDGHCIPIEFLVAAE